MGARRRGNLTETLHRSQDVIGEDTRRRVDDVTAEPFRWVCQLLGRSDGTSRVSVGSGYVVGRRVIATAAHNLWIANKRVQRFRIYLGLDGNRQAPRLGVVSTDVSKPHPSYQFGDTTYDFAVLVLPAPLSEGVGKGTWEAVPASNLHGRRGAVAGYPRHTLGGPRSSAVNAYQYYGVAPLQGNGVEVYYTLDTSPGQSGGPILARRPQPGGPDVSTLVGIHLRGLDNPMGNRGILLHPELVQFLGNSLAEFED